MKKIAYESTIFMDKIFWKYFSELSKKLANVSNRLLQPLYYYKKMLSYKCTCQMLLYLT